VSSDDNVSDSGITALYCQVRENTTPTVPYLPFVLGAPDRRLLLELAQLCPESVTRFGLRARTLLG
jgi:hypothetical protein